MRTDRLNIVVERLMDVCRVAAPTALLQDLGQHCIASGLSCAVARRDTPPLFDWLARVLSFQGVSDSIAATYLDQHGTISHAEIARALAFRTPCPKLTSYWHFHECRFAKVHFACGRPEHLPSCSLPTHDLRNGRLNQAAYALFLFIRDVCGGDLVGWIDARLAGASEATNSGRSRALGKAVIGPLNHVFGISYKVLSLALSDLLLGAAPDRPLWAEAGAAMIVVDTLVHNWLHRTGCLDDLNAAHAYGPACYAKGGCADVLAVAAQRIDARQFCPEGPAVFPRLIQKAVWLFCAEGGQDICNGNRINDHWPCQNSLCPLITCARKPLKQQ